MTLLWYDNAHEQTRGHERHTQADDETIRFLGMPTLCDRFKRDVEELTCVSCDWPESDASERDTPRPRSRSPSADANASTSLRVAVSIPPKSARTSTTLLTVLNFGPYAELDRLLSLKNLELLGATFEHEPESVREAAGLVDRDYKHVHRNLSELGDIDVIELEGGGTR